MTSDEPRKIEEEMSKLEVESEVEAESSNDEDDKDGPPPLVARGNILDNDSSGDKSESENEDESLVFESKEQRQEALSFKRRVIQVQTAWLIHKYAD